MKIRGCLWNRRQCRSKNETAAPTTSASADTEITPLVKVSDQAVEDGVVTVDTVISSGPGWIAIYSVENGEPGQQLGYSPVRNGDNKNVIVQIDPSRETDALMAVLHVDAGKAGIFEFPGPDEAVVEGLHFVSAQFIDTSKAAASRSVDNQALPLVPTFTPVPLVPSVTVMDQPIHQGMVLIPLAYSIGNTGWSSIRSTRMGRWATSSDTPFFMTAKTTTSG